MNPLNKTSIARRLSSLPLVLLGLLTLQLLPQAQAVVPAPDGGYRNFTTAEGQNALLSLTSGTGNTAVGALSLESVTTASFNTAVGAGTLLLNNADENTAIGAVALLSNTTGSFNTAVGASALVHNVNGGANVALGSSALATNSSGNGNVAVGVSALTSNTSASSNTAVGNQALRDNTVGHDNVAVGLFALATNQGGIGNTAIGQGAGQSITGNSNICIGQGVFGVAGQDNAIRIGDNLTGGYCFIGNIWNVGPGVPNAPVLVSDTGRLGVNTSSRRFKRDIKPMADTSDTILNLKPVTFHYKDDARNTPCFGLIAEEVAEVNPDLVLRDKDGKPFTVRYEQINAMLLNEFLKEHKKVEQQQASITGLQATVAQQRKGMEVLTAQLKEQAAQIQKVSAQVEMSRPAPRVAAHTK